MKNHELDAKVQGSPSLVQKAAQQEAETVGVQRDPLAQLTCRAGDGSCAGAHASELNRAPDTQPSSAGQSLLRLQRQYGNQFVQRVMRLSRKGESGGQASDDVEQAIQGARGGGQALDSGVRAQMEPALGADFSNVRVHADAGADALSQSLQARAFTTGQDVFFRQGAYDPGSSSGRGLLAHELTHVVQQNGDEVRRKLTVGQPGDRYELEADQVAQSVLEREQHSIQEEADDLTVRRQVEEEEERFAQTNAEDTGIQRQEEEEEKEEIPTQAKIEESWAQRQSEEEEKEPAY
jgi:hypothetical protein